MLLVNLENASILYDEEIKRTLAGQQPYQQWVDEHLVRLSDFVVPDIVHEVLEKDKITQLQLAFGYSKEDIKFILVPMMALGTEPIGSMGNDTALAVFRSINTHVSNYFKQLFAQVSNPAIDPIREKAVMSLVNYLGSNPVSYTHLTLPTKRIV